MRAIAMFLLCLLAACSDQQPARKTFIVAGQSNAHGLAAPRIPINVGAVLLTRPIDVFYMSCVRDHADTWAVTLHTLDPDASGTGLYLALRHAYPDDDLTVILYARCGAAVADMGPGGWFPGAAPASGNVNDGGNVAKLLRAAEFAERHTMETQGRDLRYQAMFWLQGEGDARYEGVHLDVLPERLANLFWRFRRKFGAELPIVTAPIREIDANHAKVNEAYRKVAETDRHLIIVESADLEFMDNEDGTPNPHYVNAGLAQLAVRMVEAVKPPPDPAVSQTTN